MKNEVSSFTSNEERWKDQLHALDLSAIVAITDGKGVITYANEKFCELSKYSEEEIIGKTHAFINSGYHPRDFFKNMWQTILKGEVWRGEVCNRAKDGSLYWVDTTIVPFMEEAKPKQFIAIRYDITHKKATEEELELEKQRLVESEKMASIGVLSAGIAHELGNPLGAIRGRLEMLELMIRDGKLNVESILTSIDKMIQNVDRMSKIIRGLKSYARDGQKDPKVKFLLNQLLGDILEISKDKMQKLGIQLKMNALDKDLYIVAREVEIGQVFVNLINNACDAIKDEKDPWISISLEEDHEFVTIKFSDSGAGVPKEIQNKIFDPFYTTKDAGSGTGLGLSICRSIIENHEGELYIDNALSHTCFVVQLPKTFTLLQP